MYFFRGIKTMKTLLYCFVLHYTMKKFIFEWCICYQYTFYKKKLSLCTLKQFKHMRHLKGLDPSINLLFK